MKLHYVDVSIRQFTKPVCCCTVLVTVNGNQLSYLTQTRERYVLGCAMYFYLGNLLHYLTLTVCINAFGLISMITTFGNL